MSKTIFISYFIMDELNLCSIAIADNGMVYDSKPFHIDKTLEEAVEQLTAYYGINGTITDPDLIMKFKSYDPDFKTIFIGDIKNPDSPEFSETVNSWISQEPKKTDVPIPVNLMF